MRVRIIGKPKDPAVMSGHEDRAFASSTTIYVGIEELKRSPPPTDDELLWTLGHEMTHIHRDHYAKALLADESLKKWQETQWTMGEDPAPIDEGYRSAIQSRARKSQLGGYYKEQELESDRFGTLQALSAGAKPDGIRATFERMRKDEAAGERRAKALKERGSPIRGGEKEARIVRDHDRPEVRYEALRKIYGNALGSR